MITYQRKDRANSTTFELNKLSKGSRRGPKFSIKEALLRDDNFRRRVGNMFADLEDKKILDKEGKRTLLELVEYYPNLIQRIRDLGLQEAPNIEYRNQTCDEAFAAYIAHRAIKKNWGRLTKKNWVGGWNRLQTGGFNTEKKLSEVTETYLLECLNAIRKNFRFKTLEKDCKNFVQMYNYWWNKGVFEINALKECVFPEAKNDYGETIEGGKEKETEIVTEEQFLEAMEYVTIFEDGGNVSKQHQALFAYWYFTGARKRDPIGDMWDDLNDDWTTIKRFCIKRKKKLKHRSPIHYKLRPYLKAWHDEVVKEKGEATGPIFPYLREVDGSAVYNWYFDRLKNNVTVWKGLIQSLRVTRSQIIRRESENGRFLESIWVGHSQEVADASYDFSSTSDFAHIVNPPEPQIMDEETGAA